MKVLRFRSEAYRNKERTSSHYQSGNSISMQESILATFLHSVNMSALIYSTVQKVSSRSSLHARHCRSQVHMHGKGLGLSRTFRSKLKTSQIFKTSNSKESPEQQGQSFIIIIIKFVIFSTASYFFILFTSVWTSEI